METTRRRFLGGIAVASALTGTSAIQAAASDDNPDSGLLALGIEFEAIHERFLASADQLPAAQAAYGSISPTGEGLVFSERNRGPDPYVMDWYRDPTSPKYDDLRMPDGSRAMKVSSAAIERGLENGTLAARYFSSLLDRARAFEAEIEAAKEASGLDRALERYWSAETALRGVVYRLAQIRARTTAGVAIKVKATGAYAALGAEERYSASMWLAKAIWEDMGEDV